VPETPDLTGAVTGDAANLAADDAKLVTLARAARARTSAAEGAAVRDDIGRTYAAASVQLPSLRLSALQAVVAAAMSSGSGPLVAAALATDASALSEGDDAVLADVGATRVLLVDRAGIPTILR
jgi:hypothetical protein